MIRFTALLALMFAIGSVTVAQDVKPTEKEDEKKTETKEAEATKYNLRPEFKKGAKTAYQTVADTSSSQDAGTGERVSTSKSTFDVQLEVKELDEKGGASIKLSHDRVRTEKDNPRSGESSYDSSTDKLEDAGESATEALRKDHTFTLTMDKFAQISKVDGADEYLKTVTEKAGEQAAASLEMQGVAQTVSQSIKAMYRSVPETDVALKDTWTREWSTESKAIGTLTYNATYTFEAIEEKNGHKCAKITGKIETSLKKSDNAVYDYEIKSVDRTSTTWINLETRVVICSELSNSVEGIVKMGGMEISVKSSLKGTVTLKDENFKESDPPKKKEDKKEEDKKEEETPEDEDDF